MKFIVVGDIMIDKTVYGDVYKISPEAPVPVIDLKYETNVLGGSGNVVKNLTSMGHGVRLIGHLGPIAANICSKDKRINTDYCHIVEKDNVKLRYTDIKTGYQLLRVDNEDIVKEYGSITDGPWQYIDYLEPDGIILSDYGKGVINGNVKHIIYYAQQKNIPIFVDTRRGDIKIFKGVNWMMPNLKELATVKNVLGEIEECRIVERLELDGLIITKSENGMTYVREDGYTTSIPITSSNIVDVTGAGDTAIAAFAIAICNKENPENAMKFANYCAGIVCKKRGTATVTKEEVDSYHRKKI